MPGEEEKEYKIVKDDSGKYVSYKVYVRRDQNDAWFVLRRYKEFRYLYDELVKQYPQAKLKIPPKKIFFNFSQSTINERITGLNNLVTQILSDQEVAKEANVREFLQIDANQPLQPGEHPNAEEPPVVDPDADLYAEKLGATYSRKYKPSDFNFNKTIGKGSFGKVYLATMKETGEVFAIKVLMKNKLKSDKERKHLMSEKNVLLNNLKHPFLVALHYSFQTPNKLYFVLDYVNGGELFFHLQKERRFSENRARFYAAEIACALGYLHSRYVIYRDLKPENLLLDRYGHIVITDFGLAKEQMDQAEGHCTRTFCGTPEYLAPEVLLKQPYTYTLDWWCLGSVLYEMIFGAPPFYDRDHPRMYEAIKTREPRLEKSSVQLTEEGKSVLKQMLNKNPKERLGAKDDVKQLEQHPFFKPLDFAALEHKFIKPPFEPRVRGDDDVANIDREFVQIPVGESVKGESNLEVNVTSSDKIDANNFVSFTYSRPFDEHLN